MAKQRYINTKFWTDDYIADLSPKEKLLYIYLLLLLRSIAATLVGLVRAMVAMLQILGALSALGWLIFFCCYLAIWLICSH